MTPRALRIAAVAVLTACAMPCATACRDRGGVPKIDFERMRFQRRYQPYTASALFADSAAMQTPPEGTQSVERLETPDTTGRDARGGALARIPIPVTPQLMSAGRQSFAIYCAVCHGAGGFGGSLVAENMGSPRPGSLRSPAMRAQPAEYFFLIATTGKGRMPPLAAQLSISERWAVAAFIAGLQQERALSTDERADSLRAGEIRRIDSVLARERR